MKSLRILLLLICIGLYSCKEDHYDIVIRNATIVDVETGKLIPKRDIGISDQKIVRIAEANQLTGQDSTRIIDASGKYLIPGLWDMHVHLYFPDKDYLKMYLAKGVTGIREMSGWHLDWKDTTNLNANVPRMMISSRIMDGPNPWFNDDIPVKDSTAAIEMVQNEKNRGCEFVKLLSLVPRDQYEAIARECKKLHFNLAGHIPYCIHPLDAAKAGQTTNEHMNSILLSCSSKEGEYRVLIDSLLKELVKEDAPVKEIKMKLLRAERKAGTFFSQQKADQLIEDLSKYKMYQCPTLGVSNSHVFDVLDVIETDDRDAYFPMPPKKMPKFDSIIPKPLQIARNQVKLQMDVLQQMHQKGIKILAGSDQGYAGFNLHDELAYLVKAGLSEAEALQTATINPATYMHRDDELGSIKPNKIADLVLLNANPLEDIANTRDIDLVIFKNQVLRPQNLLNSVLQLNQQILQASQNK